MEIVNRFYVYIVFRPNGVPCYVGKGQGKRWSKHQYQSPNIHLRRIAAKAVAILPIAIIRDNLSEKDAFITEIAFIAAIGRRANGGPLVNMTDGGDGVSNPDEATREKIREASRNLSIEKRRIISEKARLRQSDPLVKKAASLRLLAQRNDPIQGPIFAAATAARKGSVTSEETKEKLRIKALLRMQDPVRRKACSNKSGKKQSQEAKDKKSASLLKYHATRRKEGRPVEYKCRDEPKRRLAISISMTKLRAKQREERLRASEDRIKE